jgi:hypothetical protein
MYGILLSILLSAESEHAAWPATLHATGQPVGREEVGHEAWPDFTGNYRWIATETKAGELQLWGLRR